MDENNQSFINVVELIENLLKQENVQNFEEKMFKIIFLILNMFNRWIDSLDILNKNIVSLIARQMDFILNNS